MKNFKKKPLLSVCFITKNFCVHCRKEKCLKSCPNKGPPEFVTREFTIMF